MKDTWKDLWELKQAVNNAKSEMIPTWDAEKDSEISLTVSAGIGMDEDLERLESLVSYPGAREISLTVSAQSAVSDIELSVGAIRHISPINVTSDRDLYVLITEAVSEDEFEVYAFSSMPCPAFAEELLTGINSPGLEVVCLWNKAIISRDVLEESWSVAVDTEQLMADIAEISELKKQKIAIEKKYQGRLGTRLAGLSDARWDYFEEESGVLNSLIS